MSLKINTGIEANPMNQNTDTKNKQKSKITPFIIGYRKGYTKRKQDAVTNTKQIPKPWIRVDETKVRCPHCDIILMIAMYPHGKASYCPNCGKPCC